MLRHGCLGAVRVTRDDRLHDAHVLLESRLAGLDVVGEPEGVEVEVGALQRPGHREVARGPGDQLVQQGVVFAESGVVGQLRRPGCVRVSMQFGRERVALLRGRALRGTAGGHRLEQQPQVVEVGELSRREHRCRPVALEVRLAHQPGVLESCERFADRRRRHVEALADRIDVDPRICGQLVAEDEGDESFVDVLGERGIVGIPPVIHSRHARNPSAAAVCRSGAPGGHLTRERRTRTFAESN